MVTRSVTRSVTQPVAIPFALAGRSMLRLPYRGASLSLAFDSQQYAMGAIGKRPAAFAFSDLITFTRASGGGRFNAQGQYEWLPANQPRIDYDPVTGECKGLLVEEQRTNLLTYSSDFATAVWTKDGTITADPELSPVSSSCFRLDGQIRRPMSGSTSQRTLSVFAKAGTSGEFRLSQDTGGNAESLFDLHAGTVSNPSYGSITPMGDGWFRCAHTDISTADLASIWLSGINGNVLIAGAQLEQASSPSSYIPTTTAQVTRAADIASVNELSPWFNASEWTIYGEYSAPSTIQADAGLWWLNNGTSLRGASLRPASGKAIVRSAAALNEAISTAGSNAAGQVHKAAVAMGSTGGVSVVINDSPPATATANIVTLTIDNLWIGYQEAGGAARHLNGHIRVLRFYPRKLSDSELQGLTQ